MTLALTWLCEGAFSLAMLTVLVSGVRRWVATITRVRLYPGAAAVGAFVALEALALAACTFVAGIALLTLGFTTAASVVITLAVLAGFAAACGTGLCLPNLGMEWHDLEHS